MLFSRKLVFALAVFIACCMPSMAGAQGSAGDRAKGLFVAGKGQYKQKQYLEALHSFQQALELVDRPSIVIMIANCHRQLQQPEKALTHYRDYLADWRRKNPGKPSPYQAVVEGHISHMKTIVELVERGEALLQEGNPASALPIFQAARHQNGWPRIRVGIALCHKQLGNRDQALAVIDEALKERRGFLSVWKERHPEAKPPGNREAREAIGRLEELRRNLGKTAVPKSPAPATPTPIEQPAPAEPEDAGTGRSVLWLAAGITTAALAVGGEVTAWVAYTRANEYFTHEPEYETYRNLTIAGHVMAGVFAAAAGASFVFYYLSGSDEEPGEQAGVMLLPTRGGASLAGTFRF